MLPSPVPTYTPTPDPTKTPSPMPTPPPTPVPTIMPTPTPTHVPTPEPSNSWEPTPGPTVCVPIKVCNTVASDGHGTAAINCAMRCEMDFAREGTRRRHLLEKLWDVVEHVPLRGHHHPYLGPDHLHWPHFAVDNPAQIHGLHAGPGDPTNLNSNGHDNQGKARPRNLKDPSWKKWRTDGL